MIKLEKDFRLRGHLYQYLKDTFNISSSYTESISQNVIQAAEILKKNCVEGTLRFDLPNPENYLLTQSFESVKLDCNKP